MDCWEAEAEWILYYRNISNLIWSNDRINNSFDLGLKFILFQFFIRRSYYKSARFIILHYTSIAIIVQNLFSRSKILQYQDNL